MTAHHQGGIDMANQAAADENDAVRNFASSPAVTQLQIVELESLQDGFTEVDVLTRRSLVDLRHDPPTARWLPPSRKSLVLGVAGKLTAMPSGSPRTRQPDARSGSPRP